MIWLHLEDMEAKAGGPDKATLDLHILTHGWESALLPANTCSYNFPSDCHNHFQDTHGVTLRLFKSDIGCMKYAE